MMWWSKKNVEPSGMTSEEVELLLGPIKSDVLDLQQRFILLRSQHKTLVSTVDNFPKPNTAANPSDLQKVLERLMNVDSVLADLGNMIVDLKIELLGLRGRVSGLERKSAKPKQPASATRKKVAKKKKAKVKR